MGFFNLSSLIFRQGLALFLYKKDLLKANPYFESNRLEWLCNPCKVLSVKQIALLSTCSSNSFVSVLNNLAPALAYQPTELAFNLGCYVVSSNTRIVLT